MEGRSVSESGLHGESARPGWTARPNEADHGDRQARLSCAESAGHQHGLRRPDPERKVGDGTMTKADRQARYERAWRRLHRPTRRFRRNVRPYWQMKPSRAALATTIGR
jgi:hypothetical protein